MPKAIWNNAIIAESEQTIVVEGNHYLPPDSVNWQYFMKSETNTVCFWKGQASYYNLEVNGNRNLDAAWYYPNPKEAAIQIKDFIAFWRGVQVQK